MVIGKTRTNQPVEGELENKDLVVKTIEQTEPNWSYDITEFPSGPSGTTASVTFCRIQQLNSELHIIMNGVIHNPTESNLTSYGLIGIYVTLPENIANKLYDCLGKKASEVADASEVRIATSSAQIYVNSTVSPNATDLIDRCVLGIFNTSNPNQIYITFQTPVQINFKAGKDTYAEGRLFLDLI